MASNCSTCGGGKVSWSWSNKVDANSPAAVVNMPAGDWLKIVYVGKRAGMMTYTVNGNRYQAGRNAYGGEILVRKGDVLGLFARYPGEFQIMAGQDLPSELHGKVNPDWIQNAPIAADAPTNTVLAATVEGTLANVTVPVVPASTLTQGTVLNPVPAHEHADDGTVTLPDTATMNAIDAFFADPSLPTAHMLADAGIKGMGQKRLFILQEAGITTVEAFAEKSVEEIALLMNVSPETAKGLHEEAKRLVESYG